MLNVWLQTVVNKLKTDITVIRPLPTVFAPYIFTHNDPYTPGSRLHCWLFVCLPAGGVMWRQRCILGSWCSTRLNRRFLFCSSYPGKPAGRKCVCYLTERKYNRKLSLLVLDVEIHETVQLKTWRCLNVLHLCWLKYLWWAEWLGLTSDGVITAASTGHTGLDGDELSLKHKHWCSYKYIFTSFILLAVVQGIHFDKSVIFGLNFESSAATISL